MIYDYVRKLSDQDKNSRNVSIWLGKTHRAILLSLAINGRNPHLEVTAEVCILELGIVKTVFGFL